MSNRRALHFVFKIADRKKTIEFLREVLGMKVLRHEEFEQGCEAACNGPYDLKWSKTMIGYGPEDSHFVLELTYNYGVKNYKSGETLKSIEIQNNNMKKLQDYLSKTDKKIVDNYSTNAEESPIKYPLDVSKGSENQISKVVLRTQDYEKSVRFWNELLEMKLIDKTNSSALLSYGEGQTQLEILNCKPGWERGEDYGRIAFSCPSDQLDVIEKKVGESTLGSVMKSKVTLPTPGKADVQVVILQDPSGHEICFVGEEGFADLSQVDPNANELLNKSMLEDKSVEWFQNKEKKSQK